MEQVSANTITGSVREQSAANQSLKRLFLMALLVATWLPLAFFILLAPPGNEGGGLGSIKTAFIFLGGAAHVPATFLFYTDKEFAEIRKQHPWRYFYVPLFLIVVTGLIFAFTPATIQAFLLLMFWGWQAYHYGRQNTGIYSFASVAESGKSPKKLEKLAIEAGTVVAILGTFKILGAEVAPPYLRSAFDYLYQFGFFAFLGVGVFSVMVYAKYFNDTTVFKTIFFFTTVFFFLPLFLSVHQNVAFLSYALAHGLQYIVFMSVVSATPEDRGQSFPYKGVATLLVFVLIVGFAFWRVNDLREMNFVKNVWAYARVADFLFGAVLGATMSHFVVDASAWRLSMEKQRAYVAKRFYFIFQPERALKTSSS
jgi:uncharacterized membrane protein YwzB